MIQVTIARGIQVTVLAAGRTDDGRMCREVLIEPAMERRSTGLYIASWVHRRTGPTRSYLSSTSNVQDRICGPLT